MKLLMLARKVDRNDSSPAGFIYNWVKKIGQKLEKLYVIAWQESDGTGLPENIEVISLPKNKLAKVFSLQRKLMALLPKVSGIFCFQNPEYVFLSAPLAKMSGKKIVFWYAHGSAGRKLRWANRLSDKILTSSDKGCRLKNRKKIRVVGQGIDTDKFKAQSPQITRQKFTILSVSRISPVKNYETLIEAARILLGQKKISNWEILIVGGPALEADQDYLAKLKSLAKEKGLEGYLKFLGPVPHDEILSYYQNCDLFVNLSRTGSLDKAVLEAMACQKLVLTSNEAFIGLLEEDFISLSGHPRNLAEKIVKLMALTSEEKAKVGRSLRNKVVKHHNLDNLVNKIIKYFNEKQQK